MRDCAAVLGLLALVLWPSLLLSQPDAEDPVVRQTEYDARLLKDVGLSSERAVLLRFFQLRTITDADRKQFPRLIEQLGNESFDEREAAQVALLARGSSIREVLEKHRNHTDPEVARRCQEMVRQIEHGPGPELTCAALRQLTRAPGADALPTLLDYLPFAEDRNVVDELLEALARSVKGPTPKALLEALKCERPERRAAAAFVLGRSAEKDIREKVAGLLNEKDHDIRYRAAQGLLAGKDPRGVAGLIGQIETAPIDLLGSIESLLFNLAGPEAPPVSLSLATPDERKKFQAGWTTWWQANEGKIDLSRAFKESAFLGLNVIPEMHANKVWECGRDGKARWELAGLSCPIDAQMLPNGRVLVAELNGGRVTERDRTGKIFWEHKVETPIACQRLPGGGTWISTNHRYFTVDATGRETMTYAPENGFFIHSAYRMRNGNVAVVSMAGEIREITPQGQAIRTIPLELQGSWSGISVTPKGTYLVSNSGNGVVQEIAADGKLVWEYRKASACYATRLPNGNTLVINNGFGMTEVDRAGTTVWEQKTGSSLWRGHRR